jgi:hypothetical protein
MFWDIVTNVGDEKKPWEDVPIEVLIEEERKRKKSLEDHRERLYAPMPMPPLRPIEKDDLPENEVDGCIIIKL